MKALCQVVAKLHDHCGIVQLRLLGLPNRRPVSSKQETSMRSNNSCSRSNSTDKLRRRHWPACRSKQQRSWLRLGQSRRRQQQH